MNEFIDYNEVAGIFCNISLLLSVKKLNYIVSIISSKFSININVISKIFIIKYLCLKNSKFLICNYKIRSWRSLKSYTDNIFPKALTTYPQVLIPIGEYLLQYFVPQFIQLFPLISIFINNAIFICKMHSCFVHIMINNNDVFFCPIINSETM